MPSSQLVFRNPVHPSPTPDLPLTSLELLQDSSEGEESASVRVWSELGLHRAKKERAAGKSWPLAVIFIFRLTTLLLCPSSFFIFFSLSSRAWWKKKKTFSSRECSFLCLTFLWISQSHLWLVEKDVWVFFSLRQIDARKTKNTRSYWLNFLESTFLVMTASTFHFSYPKYMSGHMKSCTEVHYCREIGIL